MTNQTDQTIGLTDLLALSEDARLGRAADALEKIAAAAPQLERLADAVETLTALLASCIGVGSARCYVGAGKPERTAELSAQRQWCDALCVRRGQSGDWR
ncbi:hypothetical protein [Bradyrhizobium sp. USDA 4486]